MTRSPRIYTRHGDDGQSGLIGGQRVSKDSPRLWAYGTVDELNAVLGAIRAALAAKPIHTGGGLDLDPVLARIQNDLFNLGTELATPSGESTAAAPRITPGHITRLETLIDELTADLGPLREFILPGGALAAALMHEARTVCRRAERYCVRLSTSEPLSELVIPYLNRLSDALFVLARWVNKQAGVPETTWQKDPG